LLNKHFKTRFKYMVRDSTITKVESRSDFSDKAHSMKPETQKPLANV